MTSVTFNDRSFLLHIGLFTFWEQVRRENGVPVENLLAIVSSDTNYSSPLFVHFSFSLFILFDLHMIRMISFRLCWTIIRFISGSSVLSFWYIFSLTLSQDTLILLTLNPKIKILKINVIDFVLILILRPSWSYPDLFCRRVFVSRMVF